MSDYIDRQTIIEAIHSAIYPYFCGAEDGDVLSKDEKLVLSVNKAVCTAIKALPSADAIEVVRCKDCKHNSLKRVSGNAFCDLGIGLSQIYNFCSYGERADG